MPWWLLPLLFAGGVVAAAIILNWSTIENWINAALHRTPNAKHIDIVREKINNGQTRVVTGVFTSRFLGMGSKSRESKAWVVDELDRDTQRHFGNQNAIRIKV